jgi:hypothetical protein
MFSWRDRELFIVLGVWAVLAGLFLIVVSARAGTDEFNIATPMRTEAMARE